MLEVVQARNALDALVHSVKKSMTEYGDKVERRREGRKIEAAVKDAEELLKDKDAAKDAHGSEGGSLGKAAQKLGEIMYTEAQAKEAEATAERRGDGAKQEEKVVDAEFTEVNDRKG